MPNFFLKIKKSIFIKLALLFFLIALALAITPVLAEECYPTRIKDIAEELSQASGDLVAMNEDLKDEVNQCSCNNAVSLCVQNSSSMNAVGDPCKNRDNIEAIQAEINNKTDEVSYLITLLETEKQSGLEEELQTLPEDEATALRIYIDDLLKSSKEIIAPSSANANTLDNNNYSAQNKCNAKCNIGNYPLSFEACFGATGEQKPIEMDFQVSASLPRIDLGKIEISKIGLDLPDKIKLNMPSLLNDFHMALPDISIEFPPTPMKNLANASLNPIALHSFTASLPSFNPAKFSCGQPDPSQYQCYGATGTGDTTPYIDTEWYAQTISWLSDKCQAIPTMKGDMGMPIEEKYKQCFDEKNVQTTIATECDSYWKGFLIRCIANPSACGEFIKGVCWDLKQSGTSKRVEAEQGQCSAVFQGQDEAVPAECGSDPINTLKNKCEDIKNAGQETVPEPCFFVPLFSGEAVPSISTQNFYGDQNSCVGQTVGDNSLFSASADCGISGSLNRSIAVPHIKLPDVKIPDILLPSFSFMPFLKVKLPNFIFEDLTFPDMDLCNINDCADMLGAGFNLNVPMPTLRIPDIELPPIYASLGIPGLNAKVKIEMDKMRFPEIQMPVPEFDLLKFVRPKITLPKISVPPPQIKVNFKGVNINLPNLLLGLLQSIFSLPGGCIGFGISLPIPLTISFPDYYFYWPKFPRIPNLCEGVNAYCRQLKTALNETIGSKLSAFQNAANSPIQSGIQDRLDEISAIYETTMKEAVTAKMEEIKNKIETATRNVAIYENGMVSIPKIDIPLGWITIPMSGINSELSRMPLEINFNWPPELKELLLTNILEYQLPSIPLDDLNFSKDVRLKLPGLQLPSFSFSVKFTNDYADIKGQPPSGGNPYPMNQINSNLETITEKSDRIINASGNISDVLK
jgi:hypothetical protein